MSESLNLTHVPYPDERRRTVRFPGELTDWLEAAAREDHRSPNEEIVWLLLVARSIRQGWREAERHMTDYGPSADTERT